MSVALRAMVGHRCRAGRAVLLPGARSRSSVPLQCESLRPLLERHGAAADMVEKAATSVRGRLELVQALDKASIGVTPDKSDIDVAVADAAALRLQLSFLSTLNKAERAELKLSLPGANAMLALADEVARAAAVGEDVGPMIEQHVRVPVQRISTFDVEQFSERVSATMPWAQRSEVLLTLGCDDRTTIDPDMFAPRKVNKYFTSTVPDPTAAQRSSCTSSSTSTMSFAAADLFRERLMREAIAGANADEAMDATLESMRSRLLSSLGLASTGAEVILTPSGSDAEMLPTILALGRQRAMFPEHRQSWTIEDGPAVVSFVTAAGEVGSGTAGASGLRHFAPLAPKGPWVRQSPGDLLAGVPEGMIEIIEQAPRDTEGEFLSPEVDSDLQDRVRTSLDLFPQSVAIVHVVAGCKTGLCTPSVPAVEQLREEYGRRLVIVVDACQLRSDLTAVNRWCNELEAVTLVTTSKFLQGAPFFGGVLFPSPLAKELEAAAEMGGVPQGCENYFTRFDVPHSMPNMRKSLPDWHNHGLLLRGESGLAHLESYSSVPTEKVATVAKDWADGVRELVKGASPCLTLLHETLEPPDRLGGTNTIIPIIMHPGGSEDVDALDVPTLRKAYGMLAQDLSEKLRTVASEEEMELVKFKASLGQPVKLGNLPHGVLRIALGANMVIKWFEGAKNDTVEVDRRVQESLKEDARIVAKMQVMAKYWTSLDTDYEIQYKPQTFQPEPTDAAPSGVVAPATTSKLSTVLQTMIGANTLHTEDTPIALLYDLDHLRSRFQSCASAFPDSFMHCFAMKAAPMSFIAKEAVGAGFGLECASRLEVANALRNGCAPDKVVYDAPAKTASEIQYALEKGVRLNCNTLDELERVATVYEQIGGASGTTSQIGVRVNPLLGAGKIQALSVSTASSKFGAADLDAVKDAFKEYPWLSMLHVHVGSQGCSLEMLAEGAAVIADLADEINTAAGREQITVLDIGGGLPADYSTCSDSPSFEVRCK
eukprot:SAG31_NODE_2534_length_5554_cov_3.741155_2_plen_996_part_00